MAKSKSRLWLAGLALVLAIGAFFRLYQLGDASLRGDSLEFWRICQSPVTAGEIFSKWMQLMGLSGQFPFSMACTKWFMSTFSLDFSQFALRLPSALWGIAGVGAAFVLGSALAGRGAGLLLALIMALHPFHIQSTREAYFYPPLFVGSFLLLAGVLQAVEKWQRRDAGFNGRRGFLAINLIGFGLMTYSQPTGWLVAFMCGVLSVAALADLARRKVPQATPLLLYLVGGFVVLGLPLLFAPWGLSQLLQISSGSIKAASLKAFNVSTETFGGMMFKVATSFAYGATPLRAGLTFALGLAGLYAFAREIRRDWKLSVLPLVIVGGILAFLKARESAGALFEARYVLGILPAYLCFLVLGVRWLAGLIAARLPEARRPVAAWGAGLLAVLPLVHPAWVSVHLTGQPAPYQDIVAWCDANLARGTPVLVDRWFEPANELRPYPSTNQINFTFTVPNEPVDTFTQVQWRATAQAFWEKFPDAAYMELAREYWDVPSVGPWPWPRTFFARHVPIRNEAGLELRRLGLAARGDFHWPNTNRLVVEMFYNTRADHAARMAKAGQAATHWFGPGWGYAKTQDFRDWRLLGDQAELQILNLTSNRLPVTVVLRAVAVQGDKEVQTSTGAQRGFQNGRLDEWTLGPVDCLPGVNPVVLRDPRWSAAQAPLLVESVRVAPASP